MRLWKGNPVRAVERISDAREADERVLDHLARLGCDPSEPRETTHYVYVPLHDGAVAIAAVLADDGWSTHVEKCIDHAWLVTAGRSCRLTPTQVRQTRRRLEDLAAVHGGVYDGWEAAAT
jgi:Regulator of ribonuclease activity B